MHRLLLLTLLSLSLAGAAGSASAATIIYTNGFIRSGVT